MSDAAQIWITAVPPFGPDDEGVLIAVDLHSDDPGERLVADLTGAGHEGEEGVFYLLPGDLWARYERTGPRLAVSIAAWPDVLDQAVARNEALRPCLEALNGAGRVDGRMDGRVTLLRREIETDFLAGGDGDGDLGEKPAVLLIESGLPAPASLPELFAAFGRGEAAFAVVNAD
ncbi:hypothetical protein ACWGB8_18895 [Kitasatospora sp. NPDC054939]